MARKTDQTKAEDEAKDAPPAPDAVKTAADTPDTGSNDAATDIGATDDSHTEGGSTADTVNPAPEQAPLADSAGPSGGEAAVIVPVATEIVLIGADFAAPDPEWIVTCHREEGRRRAGRRWPKGETPVLAGELTAYDLAILAADPQFSVRPAAQG